MNRMLKDAGNQSMFWASFGTFWAMYSFQEWLAIFGLVIGLFSGLVNMYAKCQEGKVMRAEAERRAQMEAADERRKEELHQAQLAHFYGQRSAELSSDLEANNVKVAKNKISD